MSSQVKVVLYGYGYWGANLARNILVSRSLDLVGVVDPSSDNLRAVERALPDVPTFSTPEQALAESGAEAVVIAAPAGLHHTLAQKALEADRHVFVEKPLALEPLEADELVELAARRGRVLMVGHTFLYSPPVTYLRDQIASGALGRVQYLYSQRLSLGRIRRDCNALWNFAPHDVSIMLYLLDEVPVEVSATSIAVIDPAMPDVFFAKLQFESGVGAHLHVSWIDPRKVRLMTVVGDEKMAVYDDVSADQKISIVDAGIARKDGFGEYESLGDFQWRTRAGDILIPRINLVEPLKVEMEAFGQACLTGAPPLTDGKHGADVVCVLAAIDESARRGGSPVGLNR